MFLHTVTVQKSNDLSLSDDLWLTACGCHLQSETYDLGSLWWRLHTCTSQRGHQHHWQHPGSTESAPWTAPWVNSSACSYSISKPLQATTEQSTWPSHCLSINVFFCTVSRLDKHWEICHSILPWGQIAFSNMPGFATTALSGLIA